ncbi:MAG: CAP domain-containing protein [Longimicrobiales bacterium]
MRTLLWLVSLAACSVAGVPGLPPGTAAPGGPEHCSPTAGQRSMDMVNAERTRHGLTPLTADTVLVRAARVHAEDMARHGFVSHQGSDGSDPSQRLDRVGYLWIWVGENIAAGQESPDDVVAGWIRSADHRANILSPEAVSAGLAMARSSEGEFGTYWVMVYAAADPPSAAAVPCHP